MNVNKILYSVVWVIVAIFIVIGTSGANQIYVHNFLTITVLLSYFACIYNWLKAGNRFMSMYVLFVLYTLFSHIGQSFVYLIPEVGIVAILFSLEPLSVIIEGLRFQLLCVSFFNLGTCIYIYQSGSSVSLNKQLQIFNDTDSARQNNDSSLFFLDLVVCVSGFLVFLDAYRFLAYRQTMSYMDAYTLRQEAGQSVYLIYSWIFLVFSTISIFLKRHIRLLFFIYATLIIIYMLCGNRSLSIRFIAVLSITAPLLYPTFFKKKYWWIWTLLFIAILSFISFISVYRGFDMNGEISIATNEMALGMGALAAIAEMGGAQYPLCITMQSVDGSFGSHLTLIYFFITAFSSSIICDLFGLSNEFVPLTEWVGESIGITSYGLGYSCIAEWYMNFKWGGCLFALFYGFILSFMECKAYKLLLNNKYLIACVIFAFLANNIFYARSQMFHSLFEVRYGFWVIIIYVIFFRNIYLKKHYNKSRIVYHER